jgi:serine/threonine protein kinase
LKILVLEYCSGRTLEDYIKRKKRLSEEEAVKILRQIINGVAVIF